MKFLFGMNDLVVYSDVGTDDFLLMLGILHVCGCTCMWMYMSLGVVITLFVRIMLFLTVLTMLGEYIPDYSCQKAYRIQCRFLEDNFLYWYQIQQCIHSNPKVIMFVVFLLFCHSILKLCSPSKKSVSNLIHSWGTCHNYDPNEMMGRARKDFYCLWPWKLSPKCLPSSRVQHINILKCLCSSARL